MISSRIQDPTHLAHCLEITFKDVFFDDLSNPLSYGTFQFVHDLKTNNLYRIESLFVKNHRLHQISSMTSSPSPNPIEKAWETQLLHVQSKVDHSAYRFPSATGWQSSKKFHSEMSDGISEDLFFVIYLLVMGMLKGFLRMKFEIRVDVFGEVLIGCLLILSRWVNAKWVWYLHGWEPHSSPNLSLIYSIQIRIITHDSCFQMLSGW